MDLNWKIWKIAPKAIQQYAHANLYIKNKNKQVGQLL